MTQQDSPPSSPSPTSSIGSPILSTPFLPPSIGLRSHTARTSTTIAITSLRPLSTLPTDDDSDSDIEFQPGGRTPYAPYPNCCRWHLTDVRSQYKCGGESTACAPFAVKVASSNLYVPALGIIDSLAPSGTQDQIHTPLRSLAILPHVHGLSRVRLSTPPPSPLLKIAPSQTTQQAPVGPVYSMPSQLSAPPMPRDPALWKEVSKRWYAVMRGREVCVIQGWCVHNHVIR